MKIKKLVVDTAAFVKNVPLWEHGEECFTVPEVIAEIKDRQTKNLINSLPIELQFRVPSPTSIKFIIDFTKKTGDYASLSLADIKVLALTYELEVESKGSNKHLRLEPVKCRTTVNTHKPASDSKTGINIEGFYLPQEIIKDKENMDDSLSTTSSSNIEESMNTLTIDSSELQNDEGFSSNEEYSDVDDEEDEDDDEGWITPSNLKSIKNKISPEDVPDDMDTACITADYAMQNTLKHIGLKVMGVDGKLIYNLRTFILRCYACFKTTDKMDLLFCKHCGNKTLKKVSVTMNPDGTQKIWISTKRPINIRGTKFSLPRPRGGKHAINPILVSDQREAQQRTTKLAKMRNDPMHEDYGLGVSPFVLRDVYSRSAQLGITSDSKKIHRGLFYWEQRNPNVAMKKKSGRKK